MAIKKEITTSFEKALPGISDYFKQSSAMFKRILEKTDYQD